MLGAGDAKGQKLKVFISYSRRDLAFADQIAAILEWQGFQVIIDRKGIHGAENWEQRLGQLILESDTVVFVLSPDSAASDVCKWEVEEAARRAKRFVPVLCRALEGTVPHDLLRDLNYIHFYAEPDVPNSGFGTGQVRLIEALKVDVQWLREHTRLEELAARWHNGGRAADLLVRGSELAGYKAWRDRRPPEAPELTALQRALLASSEEEEALRASAERKRLDEMAAVQAERQRALDEAQAALKREAEAQSARARARRISQWVGAAAALLVVTGALGFGWMQQQYLTQQEFLTDEARKQETEAIRQKLEAERQAKVANEQKAKAEAESRRADAFVRLVDSNPAGRRAMEKICQEAVSVTSTLATTDEQALHQTAASRFRELYYASMYIVELHQRKSTGADSLIESEMIEFKHRLDSSDGQELPRRGLCQNAKAVRMECVKYLKISAPEPCQ